MLLVAVSRGWPEILSPYYTPVAFNYCTIAVFTCTTFLCVLNKHVTIFNTWAFICATACRRIDIHCNDIARIYCPGPQQSEYKEDRN